MAQVGETKAEPGGVLEFSTGSWVACGNDAAGLQDWAWTGEGSPDGDLRSTGGLP